MSEKHVQPQSYKSKDIQIKILMKVNTNIFIRMTKVLNLIRFGIDKNVVECISVNMDKVFIKFVHALISIFNKYNHRNNKS